MSYRPDEQSLEGPLRKILEGVKEYDAAVQARMVSSEWQDYHLSEIDSLNQKFLQLRHATIRIMKETW